MISKCSNIVINRTKFSDFDDFDASQSAEGLKLVGYLETVDPITGEKTNKNVAIDYPSVKIIKPSSYFIPSVSDGELDNEFVVTKTLSDGSVSFHVLGTFQGDLIQINFDELDIYEKNGRTAFWPVGDLRNVFTISFAKDVVFGHEIKVLFRNFPIYRKETAVRLVDFSPECACTAAIQSSEILFQYEDRFYNMWYGNDCNCGCECGPCPCKPFNFLVTFNQTAIGTATTADASKRKMIATSIELVD